MTFPDPGARHNPFIGRVYQLFEVFIRKHSRRDVAPERSDFRLWQCFVLNAPG
jgi:hypothetical protein